MRTVLLLLSFPDATAIASASLWSLALYLGFSPISNRLEQRLIDWMTTTRHLLSGVPFLGLHVTKHQHPSANHPEEARHQQQRDDMLVEEMDDSPFAIYASLIAIVPFLLVGALCSYGMEWSLGRSWAVSWGILACMGCGVYELGRRDGQSNE